MPDSRAILDGLGAIANGWRGLAVVWHVVLGIGAAALVLGWRPDRRLAGGLCAMPLISVSALAWVTGNPFNGTVFGVLAAALLILAVRLPPGRVGGGAGWAVAAGAVLVSFGWIYPHFQTTGPWATCLYAAPLGLIPCPTLSALVGIALIAGGCGSRGSAMMLAAAGAVYGLIGWLRLGVSIDVILLAGAVLLGATATSGRAGASLAR